jgi:hypothetical protein
MALKRALLPLYKPIPLVALSIGDSSQRQGWNSPIQLLWQITGEFGRDWRRCHDFFDIQSNPLPPINIALFHTD